MNANAPHIETDNRIDRALSALRDAQPRPGLNSRILAGLDHLTEKAGGPSFRIAKGWGIARGSAREKSHRAAHLALWTAASAAVIAIASLVILHYSAPTKNSVLLSGAPHTDTNKNALILSEARSAESKNSDSAPLTTNSKPFSTTNLAQATERVPGPESPQIHNERTSSNSRHPDPEQREGEGPPYFAGWPIHGDGPAVVMSGGTTTPTDAQALADLHAPSHPAPPLPLTRQEKLFLHVLRYGNATQLAELNPILRAKQDADETTAFKAFFPDPPPLDQSNGATE